MPAPASAPERILQRLDWTVIRRLDGLLQGNYKTVFRGFGLELAELREYQFNDDVRAIDWYVTARTQTPYIRLRVEDRDLTAWFLLDLSPSMDFGTARKRKSDLLVDSVGVLARLLTRHGNRVGALVYQRKLDPGHPRRDGTNAGPEVDRHPGVGAEAASGSLDEAIDAPGGRPASGASPVAPVHRLGFHQRPRLGTPPGNSHPEARGGCRSPARPAGKLSSRHRDGRHGRCRVGAAAPPGYP